MVHSRAVSVGLALAALCLGACARSGTPAARDAPAGPDAAQGTAAARGGARTQPTTAGEITPAAGVESGSGAVRVTVSIYPLADLARRVARDRAEVAVVLPPGVDPHTFDMTPADAERVASAQLLFRIGHGLDDWAAALAPAGADVVVDRGVPLRPLTPGSDGAGADPHYWLTPYNASLIASTMAEELGRLDPAGATVYDANARALTAELTTLDADLRAQAAALPDHRIATFHDAWYYFAEAFGLDVVSTFQPTGGHEPSAAWIANFQDTIKATGVKAVFGEPQSPALGLEPIARDLGLTVGVLDDIGGDQVPPRDTYAGLLHWNMDQIATALGAPVAVPTP